MIGNLLLNELFVDSSFISWLMIGMMGAIVYFLQDIHKDFKMTVRQVGDLRNDMIRVKTKLEMEEEEHHHG